jgi:hypothetical protein
VQVHIFGHSLGSVLSYDILCHQPKPFLAEFQARSQASAGGAKSPSKGDGGLKGIPENMPGEPPAVEERVSGVKNEVGGGNTIGGEEQERDPGSGTEEETSGGEGASETGAERKDERPSDSEPAAESSGDSKEGSVECSRGGEEIRGAVEGERVGEGVRREPEDECLEGGFAEQKSIVDGVLEGAVGGNHVGSDEGTARQSHSGTGEIGDGEQGGAASSGEATPGTGVDASEGSQRSEGFPAEFSERPDGEETSTVNDDPDSGKSANGANRNWVTGDAEVAKLREEVAQLKEKLRRLEELAGHNSVQSLDAVGGRPVAAGQLSLADGHEEISPDRKESENGRESVEESEHEATGGSTSTGSAMKLRHGQAEVDSGDVSKASGVTRGKPSPDPQSNPDASNVNKPQPADTNSPHSDPPQPAQINQPQPDAEAPHSASVNTDPAAVYTKVPLMSSPSIDISAADLKGGAINPEVLRKRGPHAFIHYPRLAFEVDTFFAVGSPLGMFLALRNIEFGSATRGENMDLQRLEQSMPAARHMMNIFHPYDPVAYRCVVGSCPPESVSKIVSHPCVSVAYRGVVAYQTALN